MDMLDSRPRTPEQHRAIVAAIPDRPVRQVLSWPTGERLARTYLDAARTLVLWRDLMEPARVSAEPDPSDDGRALVIHRSDRPTEDEIIAAWLRPTYVTRRISRGVWEHPLRRHDGGLALAGRVYLGALVYHAAEHEKGGPMRGELVHWGFGRRGQPQTPHENLTLSGRGGRRKQSPGTRQRRVIDPGGDWDLHQSNSVSLDDQRGDDVFDEVMRQMEARAARKAAGPYHADVLDCAISSMTAREIGEHFGYVGKYAERKGVRLVDEAIAHMQRIAANDNVQQESRAAAA